MSQIGVMRTRPILILFGAILLLRIESTFGQRGDGRPPLQRDSFAGSRAGAEREVARIRLCWCPAGHFKMGSPPSEPERRPDEGQVDVTLTRGFWIGKYEAT